MFTVVLRGIIWLMNGVIHLACRTQQRADCRIHLYGVRRRQALCSGCISEAVLCNVWIAGRVSSPPPNSL